MNVGFARPGPGGIDLVVWERGAGLTDACGTGACAAAVAAVRARRRRGPGRPWRCGSPAARSRSPSARTSTRVTMRGPAERAFAGETDL